MVTNLNEGCTGRVRLLWREMYPAEPAQVGKAYRLKHISWRYSLWSLYGVFSTVLLFLPFWKSRKPRRHVTIVLVLRHLAIGYRLKKVDLDTFLGGVFEVFLTVLSFTLEERLVIATSDLDLGFLFSFFTPWNTITPFTFLLKIFHFGRVCFCH